MTYLCEFDSDNSETHCGASTKKFFMTKHPTSFIGDGVWPLCDHHVESLGRNYFTEVTEDEYLASLVVNS